MEDFGTGLYFTLNGEDDDIFCQNCRKLREQLKEEENGREETVQVIQDKVILTDRLVKSFEKKTKLHEHSARTMGDQEKLNKSLSERCAKYEAELSKLISELQSLRTTNQTLVEEKEKCSKESCELKNQIAAYEVTIQQYKNFCDEKKADDVKAAASKKILNSKEKEISKLKEDVARLTNLVQEKKNEVKKRKALYRKAVLHVEKFVKNLESSEAANDEKLIRLCQHMLEKVKSFGSMGLDDIEGSFDSEAEDGKKIEDLFHSDVEASPVTKSSHIAVSNPQFEAESILSHKTSGAEGTFAGNKDKDVLAVSQPAAVNQNTDVCGGNNRFYNNHLQGACSSDPTSTITVNGQVSDSDAPSYNDTVKEISTPSNFKDSAVENSGIQYIADHVGKARESTVCETTSNKSLASKNGNYVEAHNILLDGSDSLDDFSSDFAEMKSQMCLKKEMLSPLSPLPPTPPPRSSSSPDAFRDRYAGSDRPRGRSIERHRNAPWSKNLLHQPSEGFEPAFDEVPNSYSGNEYLQQQRRSSNYFQPKPDKEGNSNASDVNGTPSDKSFEASILYDEQADCFSLSVDPKSKGLVTIKAFKSGVVSFNWRDSKNQRNFRSHSCVARIQSPSSEDKAPPGMQTTVKNDSAVGSTRVQDHQNFSGHIINQEYTDKSSSLKRKLFKEPRLPQFTAAASTISSNSLTRPSSDTLVKSENADSSFKSSFRKSSEQNMAFSVHVKPSIASKPLVNHESNLSVHFRSEEETISNSSNQASKGAELPHRQELKSEEADKAVHLNKSDSADFSCSLEAVNVNDEEPSSKLDSVYGKRHQKPNKCVDLDKPAFELPHSGFPEVDCGQPVLPKCEGPGSNSASSIRSFSPGVLSSTDFSGFKEKSDELSEDCKGLELLELHSSTPFHKLNKCVPLGESNISSIPCPQFQSLSNVNEQESSQDDSVMIEKESQEVLVSEMPEQISSLSFFESELQNVSNKVQSVIHEDITNQTFLDAESNHTEYGESKFTVQSAAGLELQNESHENRVLSGNQGKPVPSEESRPQQNSELQSMGDVTEESSSPAKKFNPVKFQRHSKHMQSDECDKKQVFQKIHGHSVVEPDSPVTCLELQEVDIFNSVTNSCETDMKHPKANKDTPAKESNFAVVTSPNSNDISGLSNKKRQDLVVVHQSGSTVSLKSPHSSSPKEIYSPSLPPPKLSEVDEGEALTSQSELCDLETHVSRLPKKRKRSTECESLAVHSKVQKMSSLGFGADSLETDMECQAEIISHGESSVSLVTSECSDTPDLNKVQDLESSRDSSSLTFLELPGNAHSPKKVWSPALPPSKLARTDEVESLTSQTKLHDPDTEAEHLGKCVLPQKKNLAKVSSSHTRESHNQGNSDHNLRSSNKSRKAELRSLKSLSVSSSRKSPKSSPVKGESVKKTKKKHEVKKRVLEQSACMSPDKPSTPEFVQARFQKIKNLNKFDEILEPVKPKHAHSNKRKRKSLEISHAPSGNNAVNGNIQNDLHLSNGQIVSSLECESTVNVQAVVSNNKDVCDISTGKQTPSVKNRMTDITGLNGIKQTLNVTNEIQVDGSTGITDVQQRNLENSQKAEKATSVLASVSSKKLIVTVATVHQSETEDDFTNMDSDATSEMCNGNQVGTVTQPAFEISDATNQLNGLINVNGTGIVKAEVMLNGGSEKKPFSHAFREQEKNSHMPIWDSESKKGIPTDNVLTQKCNQFESLEQKPIPSVENKALFMSPLCDDDYFRLGLGNISFNPMLLAHLENLKKASSFNCKGVERLLIAVLGNPIQVPDVREAVLTIVHFLSSCEDDPLQYINEASDISPPVILPYEEYLINSVLQAQGKQNTHLKNFIPALFSVIKAQIIFNKSLKLYGVASLCRIFTKLHKISNNLAGLRVLCYDILVAHPHTCNVPYLLAAIVGVWPKVLQFEEVFQGAQNPMYLAVSSILFNRSFKYSDAATKCLKIICHLSKLCPSENLPSTSTEVLQKIFDDLMENENNDFLTEEQANHYARAVELICIREDWKWAYNRVLVKHLYPFLNWWIVKNSTSEQPGNISTIKTVFNLLCVVCCFVPPDESETINRILTNLRTFLVDPTQKAPFAAQEAAFLALLRLGSLNKGIAVPTIFTWLEKNKKEISPGTWNSLKVLPYISSSDIDTLRFQS